MERVLASCPFILCLLGEFGHYIQTDDKQTETPPCTSALIYDKLLCTVASSIRCLINKQGGLRIKVKGTFGILPEAQHSICSPGSQQVRNLCFTSMS